jgi:hypothetical protein
MHEGSDCSLGSGSALAAHLAVKYDNACALYNTYIWYGMMQYSHILLGTHVSHLALLRMLGAVYFLHLAGATWTPIAWQ